MTDTPKPIVIPGNDLLLPETDLLMNIGKYLALYEHEQKKRIALAQAYMELKAERDELAAQVKSLSDHIEMRGQEAAERESKA